MRALLALALLTVAVHTAPVDPERPETLVRLDAIAADAGGRLVRDLKADDFEILEQGTPRPIASVQFVSTNLAVPVGNEAPKSIESSADERFEADDDARLFAIFLDEYHVSAG